MNVLKYCKEHNRLYGHDTPMVNENGERCLYYRFILNGIHFCLAVTDIEANAELYGILNKNGLISEIVSTKYIK